MAMASPPIIPQSPSQPSVTNLRNPLPLSATQEQEVKKLFHARVRAKCADEIKQFAACAQGRMFSVAWACKTQQFHMNSCMMANATHAEQDAAREEWFQGVNERRRKKAEELEKTEERRRRVIELTRLQEEREAREAEGVRLGKERQKEKEGEGQGKKGGWWR